MGARAPRFLLIDISNSFTKIACSQGEQIGRVVRIPTPGLTARHVETAAGSSPLDAVVLSSVVPKKERMLRAKLRRWPIIRVGADLELGVGIDYPNPPAIGADRLANAAGAARMIGAPCVVVDFGTAVTFDIIARGRGYIGGVIAPGLDLMTEYLHRRTALLPKIDLLEPVSAIGRSTVEAMRAGAVYGYRGLVREILMQIRKAAFPKKRFQVVATGGYAELIAAGLPEIDRVEQLLTLHGLRIIGTLNHRPKAAQKKL